MINTINLAYYSHSVKTYNSDKENKEYDFLKTIIKGHVICPNQHIGKLETSEIYQNIIKKVDCVFVSENEGFVGKGSYGECVTALENNIPVVVIKNKNNNLVLELVTELIQVSEYNLFQYGQIISKGIIKKSFNNCTFNFGFYSTFCCWNTCFSSYTVLNTTYAMKSTQ